MDEYEKSKLNNVRYKKIKKTLKEVFGYEKFKARQYEIINTLLNKEDVCAIMPTGYGKSLCFQLPAIYKKGIVIVVSPLISLMNDQRSLLDKLGIKSCCYNSTVQNKRQLREDILESKYSLVYITPESIYNDEDFIDQMNRDTNIIMFAIDEAHCISSYGHEFRASYRNLCVLRKICPKVPIFATTATATDIVAKDIVKVLSLKGKIIIAPFDRPNLHITIQQRSSTTKDQIVKNIKKIDGSVIIYCLTKKDTENLAMFLQDKGIKSAAYHAGKDSDIRKKIQDKFSNGIYKVICATIAFGMGINKADVRLIINYGCPKNIEEYYQEIGRAGRDGKPSECHLYFTLQDFIIQKRFIEDIDDQAYKKHRTDMLGIMNDFVNLTTCRKKMLLEYFGDYSIEENCNMCDNCDYKKNPKILRLSSEQKDCIRKLLSVIKYVDGDYGMTVVIGILRGSKSKKIPTRYYDMSLYGTGKQKKDEWWKDLIILIKNHGFIKFINVSTLVYVPIVTEIGSRWLKKYEAKNNFAAIKH